MGRVYMMRWERGDEGVGQGWKCLRHTFENNSHTPFPKITGTWKCSLSFINSTCVSNALCVSKHLMIKWVDLISFFAKNTFNRWINGYKIKSNLGSNSQNYNCLM